MELGSGEIVMILIVALLIYGGRLPEVARSIGKSFGELKRGFTETKDVVAAELNADLDLNDGLDESRREVQRVTAAAQAPPELLASIPANANTKPTFCDRASRLSCAVPTV